MIRFREVGGAVRRAIALRTHRLETRFFRIGLVVGLVHVVDEYAVRSAQQDSFGRGALLVGSGLLATVLVPLLWAALRVLATAVLGGILVANGATHAAHVLGGDVVGLDLTGLLAAMGGVTVLITAGVAAFRRDRPASHPLIRWADRFVTLALVLLVGVGVMLPIGAGTVQVHLPRRLAEAPPDDYTSVSLATDDGIELAAWYLPSRNGAAVMVLGTSRGDHLTVTDHARLLADHGYGVLVYDARGTGASSGVPNGWGWTWREDVEAGIDFLDERTDVVGGRIGLLGLSTGADVAIEVAAVDSRVQVVVADGATAQGFADRPAGLTSAMSLWPMYATATVLTGDHPMPPLADVIARIAPRPVLLIAAGSTSQEIPLNQRYAAAGGDTVTLWVLPDARHTAALRSDADRYAQRVLPHLDRALRVT